MITQHEVAQGNKHLVISILGKSGFLYFSEAEDDQNLRIIPEDLAPLLLRIDEAGIQVIFKRCAGIAVRDTVQQWDLVCQIDGCT